MEKAKHTPGPWQARKYNEYAQFQIEDFDRREICVVNRGLESVCEANAHLIAAAPEMKDELIGLRQCFRDLAIKDHSKDGIFHAVANRIDSVIAKAEGRVGSLMDAATDDQKAALCDAAEIEK